MSDFLYADNITSSAVLGISSLAPAYGERSPRSGPLKAQRSDSELRLSRNIFRNFFADISQKSGSESLRRTSAGSLPRVRFPPVPLPLRGTWADIPHRLTVMLPGRRT